MAWVVLFGVFQIGKAQSIDGDLLGFERSQRRVGENLNLELPVGCLCFWCSCSAEHDFLALHIDTIVITIPANLEDSGGLGRTFLFHNAFLSTVRPQNLRSMG